jgi:hypothetical protein
MSKFVSVAAAVALAITGVIGLPHTSTKPVATAVHKLVAHHWSKSLGSGDATHCDPSYYCQWTYVIAPTPSDRLSGYAAVLYTGQPDAAGTLSLAALKLPAAVTRALRAEVSVRGSVTISGTKGHAFELAPTVDVDASGSGEIGPLAVLKSSGTIQTRTDTLPLGSTYVGWAAEEFTKGSTALLGRVTVNVTYYTLD